MESSQYKLQADLEQVHWWHLGKRLLMERIVRHVLSADGSSVIVDYGCGTGGNLIHLARRYRCFGVDESTEALALARQTAPEARFIESHSAGDLGDVAGRADLFLLMDVLEHLRDDRGTLATLTGSCKPGVSFFLTVPADPALWGPHDKSLGHYRRYDESSFRALWEGLPIREEFVSYFNSTLYYPILLLRKLSGLRGRAWGKSGTDVGSMPLYLNAILLRLLVREGKAIERAYLEHRESGFRRGATLVALLRRTEARGEG